MTRLLLHTRNVLEHLLVAGAGALPVILDDLGDDFRRPGVGDAAAGRGPFCGFVAVVRGGCGFVRHLGIVSVVRCRGLRVRRCAFAGRRIRFGLTPAAEHGERDEEDRGRNEIGGRAGFHGRRVHLGRRGRASVHGIRAARGVHSRLRQERAPLGEGRPGRQRDVRRDAPVRFSGGASNRIPASSGVRLPFLRLQVRHEITRLSQESSPPRDRGTT